MEKFESNEYRKDLAEDLKTIRKVDPEAAQKVLENESQTREYNVARAEKVIDHREKKEAEELELQQGIPSFSDTRGDIILGVLRNEREGEFNEKLRDADKMHPDTLEKFEEDPQKIVGLTESEQMRFVEAYAEKNGSLARVLNHDYAPHLNKIDPNYLAEKAIKAGSAYYVGYSFDDVPVFKNIDLERLTAAFLGLSGGRSDWSSCRSGLQYVWEKVDIAGKKKIGEAVKKFTWPKE